MPKTTYSTRQREALKLFMKRTAGQHISAEEVVGHFARSAEPIGRATIYRNLKKLEQDGLLQRYTTGNRKAACFQYLEAPEELPEHFHLMCELCGSLQHVECSALGEMEEHIKESHDFKVNPLRTVMYGLCHECMRRSDKDTQHADKNVQHADKEHR